MNNYKKVVLDNGVRLYVHSDKTMRQFYVSFNVEYGCSGEYFKFNYDGKDYSVIPGCAHFLEHLLLEHSPYGDLYNYFSSIKYFSNARTSLNLTTYYFYGSKNIKSSIKKLINSIEKPVFTDKDILDSSHAIAEETKRGLNNPFYESYYLTLRDAYKSFDLAHESLSLIGTEDIARNTDYNILKLCYDAFYSDDRKFMVITGPLDEDDIINYIKKIYDKIPNHENKTKVFVPDNLLEVREEKDTLVRKTVEDDVLTIDFNEYFKGFTAFEVITYLSYLSDYKFSEKSKFTERLKKDGILVNYDGRYIKRIFNSDYYNLSFYFFVKDKDKLIKEFMKEIEKDDFDEEDFELYKKSKIGQYIFQTEDKYFFYETLPGFLIDNQCEFDRMETLKNTSFKRFKEFYKSIDFTHRSIVLLTKEGKDGK